MDFKEVLICPVCKSSLYRDEKSYFCTGAKRHCYDISAQGHTNLCPGKATGGDDKRAVRSRTEFLNLGHYKPISYKLCEILSDLNAENTIVDAGCGEGYYTNNIAVSTGAQTYGFDLSKEAIISASKSAKRDGIQNSRFFVGGIYNLPICDCGADAVTNIFAPCAEGEFCRILKDGGRLIIVAAGENHLYGLKKAIYDEVHTNEERADLPQGMKLEAEYKLAYKIFLKTPEEIQSLFSMTPYSYRTSEQGMQRLYALNTIETDVEFNIYVYRKEMTV